jgi:sodium/proline symporter
MNIETVAAFGLYFSILLSIGFYFYNKNKNEADFAVGGRSLNYWVTAISAQASDMSDWLFMGFPGLVYAAGLNQIWVAVGLVLFMFLTWHFIAGPFRIATEKYNSITLASFFQNRFADNSNIIRYLTGAICIYFFVFYIAAGFIGLGKVFEAAFSLSYHSGLIVGFCVTIAYTLLGGLFAIAWSDLFQGLFLLMVIMFVPAYTMNSLGGFSQTMKIIAQQDPEFLSWHANSWFAAIVSACSWGIGYFGQPHILINFMSIDKAENIKRAKIVGICWQILVLASAVFVAIAGKAFFTTPLANREMVFIDLVQTLFSPFFAGFILCAILAATISTINTQSLITGSLLSHDLIQPLLKQSLSTQHQVFLSRISLLLFPLISLAIAWYPTKNILETVMYAFSGLGASFGPIVILALYNTKISKDAVIIGLLSGAVTVITWSYDTSLALIVGFAINMCVTLFLSYMPKNSRCNI